MENKYQVSLNRLHTSIYSHCVYLNYSSSSQPFEEDIKTIQELIDKCSTMEEQVKTCEHSADKKIEQLEKALDIVCESYEWEDKPPKPYKSWKEWALKESEKQYERPIKNNKHLESDVSVNGIQGLYRCRNCGELYGNCEIQRYTNCRKCGVKLKESEKQ